MSIKKLLKVLIFILSLVIIVGCFNSEISNSDSQSPNNSTNTSLEEVDEIQRELNTTKNQLSIAESKVISLELDNQELKQQIENEKTQVESLENYITWLTDEYQHVYFDFCTKVKHMLCSNELLYFDPREIKVDDILFGMSVTSISVGQQDPTSYWIELIGDIEVTGKYTFVEDDYMGDYILFETEKLNKGNYNLSLRLEGKETINLFSAKQGLATINISKMILMRLPHKPGYNSAKLESIIKDADDIS